MKQFNITAQVYDKSDIHKQTILINQEVSASSIAEAYDVFNENHDINYEIVKIYSVEEFSQEVV